MTFQVSTVAVCDTEPIAIEGFRALLEEADDLRLVAEETSLLDAAQSVRSLAPAVLVLDKAFGIHAVADAIRAIRADGGSTRIVVWGFHISDAEALRFLQAGAGGVIRKTAALYYLLQCIRTVATGSTWIESTAVPEARTQRNTRSALTAREVQVMELVGRGLKNKDIADALGIRTGTVKIHMKHIFEKTGVRGRYGLALSAVEEKGYFLFPAAEAV